MRGMSKKDEDWEVVVHESEQWRSKPIGREGVDRETTEGRGGKRRMKCKARGEGGFDKGPGNSGGKSPGRHV